MAERLVDLYVKVCDELLLDEGARKRLWFAVSAEIERIIAKLEEPAQATFEEIERICNELNTAAIRDLAERARRPVQARIARASDVEEEPWPENPETVIALYWNFVEELAVKLRHRFNADEEEVDTVASIVKVKLFADDCAIVRKFQHRSPFGVYLNTIVQRTFFDLRVRRYGKWHYSAAAQRLGSMGMDLERMIYREGQTESEAIATLMASHPEVSRTEMENIVKQLPVKDRRPSKVSLEHVKETIAADCKTDAAAISAEQFHLSNRATEVVRQFLENLENRDRLLLLFIFEESLTIASIAKRLGGDQKALYRRRDELLKLLRKKLAAAGIGTAEAAELLEFIGEHSTRTMGKAWKRSVGWKEGS